MGEEQVYQVTLVNEAGARKEEEASTLVKENGKEVEEEEAAGDIDDPLAMLGGMGEEQVYQVTLVNEAGARKEEDSSTLVKENGKEVEEEDSSTLVKENGKEV